jgi:hypothetical protein
MPGSLPAPGRRVLSSANCPGAEELGPTLLLCPPSNPEPHAYLCPHPQSRCMVFDFM